MFRDKMQWKKKWNLVSFTFRFSVPRRMCKNLFSIFCLSLSLLLFFFRLLLQRFDVMKEINGIRSCRKQYLHITHTGNITFRPRPTVIDFVRYLWFRVCILGQIYKTDKQHCEESEQFFRFKFLMLFSSISRIPEYGSWPDPSHDAFLTNILFYQSVNLRSKLWNSNQSLNPFADIRIRISQDYCLAHHKSCADVRNPSQTKI